MTATAIRPADSPSDGALSHRQILTILSGLVLGMFLAALDQTIVSTAIKTIGNDLHDLQAQAWVTTAFLITSTIAAPLFGKLSDIYGRKRLFMIAIVIFVAGSALCGLATSMYELAAFRAFQGIGAGGIMPPPTGTGPSNGESARRSGLSLSPSRRSVSTLNPVPTWPA